MAMESGLQSEVILQALNEALRGQCTNLEDRLSRYGGMPTPTPKLKLAAAFGVEVNKGSDGVVELLQKLGNNDAAPDTAQIYLPMAAAFGWAGRTSAGKDLTIAWAALAQLAADERAPVRFATGVALSNLARRVGGADELVSHAKEWLDLEDREASYSASATILEVLASTSVLSTLKNHQALFEYLSRVLFDLAEMPRSAERSDGRRRMLQILPKTLGTVVMVFSAADRGIHWLAQECAMVRHPSVREVLSGTIVKLSSPQHGLPGGAVELARIALKASAKPLRDPSRVRPGSGRGKKTRRIR
jgi:hypothetical protein